MPDLYLQAVPIDASMMTHWMEDASHLLHSYVSDDDTSLLAVQDAVQRLESFERIMLSNCIWFNQYVQRRKLVLPGILWDMKAVFGEDGRNFVCWGPELTKRMLSCFSRTYSSGQDVKESRCYVAPHDKLKTFLEQQNGKVLFAMIW